jgi:hypothetical protein
MMCIVESNEEYSLAQDSEMELKIMAYNKRLFGNQDTCG